MTDFKFPTEVVELPSKGYFYPKDSPLSSGKVEMKYMTAKEEDILTSPNLIAKNLVVDKLLESLIINKDIKLDDLLIGDKNALILAARVLGYGKDYQMIYIDDNGEEQQTTIDLSTIQEKQIDFSKFIEGTTHLEYQLPLSKVNLRITLLTSRLQKKINEFMESLAKINSDTNTEITSRLKHIILSVEDNTEQGYIHQFVDNELLAVDSFQLRKFIQDNTPDVDMVVKVQQPDGTEKEVAVILTAQFLWPTV
tara:strand:- start:266 stop:1021 length:756 start_codon:yes stop_codon:yes gene_type:complete